MKKATYLKIVDLLKSVSCHAGCEDGYYACPKSEDYFGVYDAKPTKERPCFCFAEDAIEILKELDEN